ncbi:MAG: fused response regulator/phosphatase [Chloroflexaceae bacterium]|nr:fused response regulator/phosphatase [Chloroflexaceae bacterium]
MNKTAILCIDDEEIVLNSLKRQLRRHFVNEYLIEVAQDGEEALEVVAELDEQGICLAVVISDYMMPTMKGDAVLARIHQQHPDTMTILLTGQASTEGITNAVNQANLYRYIAKPWEQTDLILTVTEALRSYEQDRMLEEHNVALEWMNHELEQLNANLESQVLARTAELETANRYLTRLNQRMESDLQLAREIQQGLLPPQSADWEALSIASYSMAAQEVGGDFYQYHSFGPNRFAMLVGDVSGKGVSAALLMALSLALFDSMLSWELTPSERIASLDSSLTHYTRSHRRNCALVYVEMVVDPEPDSYIAHMINAGCIPPYIRRSEGAVLAPDVRGFALGQGLGTLSRYEAVTCTLFPGDLVILVSDGVIEAFNTRGEMFGFERLESCIASGPTSSANQMLAHLVASITHFTDGTEPADDLTIVVAQVAHSFNG